MLSNSNQGWDENPVFLRSLGSTNEYMKLLLGSNHAREGTLVYTQFQTAGRGQGEETWESEAGKNVLMSLLLAPSFLQARFQAGLNFCIALALHDFVSLYTPDTFIKWPNDIFAGNKKIAGILIENILQGDELKHAIIGVGLNVNQEKFGITHATSLKNITGDEVDPETCVKKIRENIYKRYDQLRDTGLEKMQEAYNEKLFRKSVLSSFIINGEVVPGEIVGVDKNGKLQVLMESGMRKFVNKELELVI